MGVDDLPQLTMSQSPISISRTRCKSVQRSTRAIRSESSVVPSAHSSLIALHRLILKHLIPLRMLNGDLPSSTLIDRFPRLHELYQPFVQALKTGNVKHFDEALVRGERRLVESGTYGVVERVREICLRGLFNKV